MKQYFPLIVLVFIVTGAVVGLASQFIDLPSMNDLVNTLTADPNATKENVLIQSKS